MRSRSLGIVFIAAVIMPSILLAVLAIRAASREAAFIERQLAATLGADVTHTAALALSEAQRVTEELSAGIDVPPGSNYERILASWKKSNPLVSVPFLLSSSYRILWPRSDAHLDADQKKFLQENGDFLNDKTATSVLQNIAVRYQAEILAETARAQANVPETSTASVPGSTIAAAPPAESAPAPATIPSGAAAAQQVAIDAFAQNADIQTKVYDLAREKGDTVSPRAVQPTAGAGESTMGAVAQNAAIAMAPVAAAQGPAEEEAPAALAAIAKEKKDSGAVTTDNGVVTTDNGVVTTDSGAVSMDDSSAAGAGGAAAKPAPSQMPRSTVAAPAQPSQYVITSQLLSEIASKGDHGLIPRFIGEKLVFLFWEREKDGRIAGCELAGSAFRERMGAILASTWSPQRILTLLDENGMPLATPPDVKGLDWRRPFVSEPVGETLPRWEAAAYLTTPGAIADRARSSSVVIWILVLILLVSVAGGGSMVLSSVYGEMRLAQKKATFVTNVSHELKTPLTSISLFVELLRQKRPVAQEKREQYLGLMASETERLTRLINNVLDFSSLQRGAKRYTLRTLDADALAAGVLESQRVRLESRGFTVSGPAETAPAASGELLVRADPEALKQILLNLLANAEKYSAGRKEISMEVGVEATGQGQEEGVLLRVRDRGIGIAEKDREKIFREFYRVNDSLASGVQGTGLGLTIARRIARDLGGDVSCEPREGGGSDFIVRLPRVQAEEEEA
jgi:signal transduction histidine kinase